MANILIIGASCPASNQIADFLKLNNKVYGISRDSSIQNGSFIKIFNYEETLKKYNFDTIIIAASRTPKDSGGLNDFLKDNLAICYFAKKISSINTRIIFFSSFSVYSQDQSLIEKDARLTNSDIYGVSKLLCEKYIQDNFHNYLLLRIPVFLYKNANSNFMAKLKYSIKRNEIFEFSNIDSKVNAFFSIYDFISIFKQNYIGLVNCHTSSDWTVRDLADYAVSLGLKSYRIVNSCKPPQIVPEINSPFIFSKTSIALKRFLNE